MRAHTTLSKFIARVCARPQAPCVVHQPPPDDLGDPLNDGAVNDFPLAFLPQICCDTGIIASALVDWQGEDIEFCDIVSAGLQQLRIFDRDSAYIPAITFRLPLDVLHDPCLADEIRWTIDSYEIAPDRVIFEIPHLRNKGRNHLIVPAGLAVLAGFGCQFDIDGLDMTMLRTVHLAGCHGARLIISAKILANCESDPRHRQVILSMLALAERFQFHTLAKGVTTPKQHGLLAQLGCSVVEGERVARLVSPDELAVQVQERSLLLSRKLVPTLLRKVA